MEFVNSASCTSQSQDPSLPPQCLLQERSAEPSSFSVGLVGWVQVCGDKYYQEIIFSGGTAR